MGFNLKKNAQKINNSVLPINKALENNADKYDLSLQKEKFIPTFTNMLERDRRPLEGDIVTHEAMLDEKRKKAATQEKITEGALGDADSPLFPHRQFNNGEDNYQITPMDALTYANDKKYRDAFAKANKDGDTAFWDKHIGDQLDGPITKVPANIPQSASQLHGNPERYGNLDNLPSDPSAIVNRDNFSPGIDIEPMHGFIGGEKGLKMAMSSLKDADGLLFGVYLQAAKENRVLSENEQELVNGINRDKSSLLLSLAQSLPPEDLNSQQPPAPPLPNPSHPEREADFLDKSPDVTNDPRLWATQSGFDPNKADVDESLESFDFNDSLNLPQTNDSPIEQDSSFDNGQMPVGQSPNKIQDINDVPETPF